MWKLEIKRTNDFTELLIFDSFKRLLLFIEIYHDASNEIHNYEIYFEKE